MDKFNRTLHGYDPDEVNAFLDQVIKHVEKMVKDMNAKDVKIKELEEQLNNMPKSDLQRVENSLAQSILIARRTSDQIKESAYQERDLIVDDAKKNANRIVNEALLKAERAEDEADKLRRNTTVFKRRLRHVLEEQLELVDEIEKIDM